MNQDLFDWLLLLARWLHITVGVTWIGTSIFFMWLDRSFEKNPESKRPGHIGDLWMVHGGGFYHVEKLQMGPTGVPKKLHWFKWESYWTWMSGMILMTLIFYTGDGTYLLDSMVSSITYSQGVMISLFTLFGSWFFYDQVWERKYIREHSWIGQILTLGWLSGMSYFLCHTLSGRAAYIHIGGMLGTWMTANVFMRIIPRQIKMVEATARGEVPNQEWPKNAKFRSTHNTYFTLPVIFIMLSNHFPQTYGHELNWLILLLISAGGAAVREYFVVRLTNPARSIKFAILGIALITGVVIFSSQKTEEKIEPEPVQVIMEEKKGAEVEVVSANSLDSKTYDLSGVILFEGVVPENKKLNLPAVCAKVHKEGAYSNEILIKNQKIQNVLVRVIKGHEGKEYLDIPKEEVILDQKGCLYTPRVVAVRVGQPVTFVNSDAIFHNVRSVTSVNQKFNMAMPNKDQRETKVFQNPEIFMQAKCSVHPWMGAFIAIMDHPFYSVSNELGEFKLKGLPAGKYTLEAWHEVFGTQTTEIEISEQSAKEINFTFKK